MNSVILFIIGIAVIAFAWKFGVNKISADNERITISFKHERFAKVGLGLGLILALVGYFYSIFESSFLPH